MVRKQRKVIWTKLATSQFNAAINYIRKDSIQNAEKVKLILLNKIAALEDDKWQHRKDPYKKNNDGGFLYFEVVHYRIVYYATAGEVFIIRLRHTSREPKKY